MKQIEITKSNVLIAQFMCLGLFSESPNIFARMNPQTGATDFHTESDLRYEKSWDWLMEVLQEVDKKEIEMPDDSNLIGDITSGLLNLDITETFEAVVEYIKWYNNEG